MILFNLRREWVHYSLWNFNNDCRSGKHGVKICHRSNWYSESLKIYHQNHRPSCTFLGWSWNPVPGHKQSRHHPGASDSSRTFHPFGSSFEPTCHRPVCSSLPQGLGWMKPGCVPNLNPANGLAGWCGASPVGSGTLPPGSPCAVGGSSVFLQPCCGLGVKK